MTIELYRSDIGFGKLTVDDTGVTRKRMIRTQRFDFDEVREYRLRIQPMNATGELGRAFGGGIAEVIDFATALGARRIPSRSSLELIGERRRLLVNWRFEYVEAAIAEILRRIGPRLFADAQRTLADARLVRFGDLGMRAEAIQWKAHEPIARARVESLEVVDNRPLHLFVRARGKSWAYARIALERIPNVLVALELAEQLGYRVLGRERLQL